MPMARAMGIVCYVLAGLMLLAALVVPVIGLIAGLVVWMWGEAASSMAIGGVGGGGHDPAGAILVLLIDGVLGLLDAVGPLPTIVVALITIIVEIGLIAGAVILILIGRRLRRSGRRAASPAAAQSSL